MSLCVQLKGGEKSRNICKQWDFFWCGLGFFLLFPGRDKHIFKRTKQITEKWGLRESRRWKVEYINQAMGMRGIKPLLCTALILSKGEKHYEDFCPCFAAF